MFIDTADVEEVRDAVSTVLVDGVAVPFPVFEAVCDHPLTREGLEQFTELYRTIPS
jgi:hypothetical protein